MALSGKITDAELEVMKILWREKGPVTSIQLWDELGKRRGWDKSTVRTLARRLLDKGAVSAHRGKVLSYTAAVAEADFTGAETREMLDKLYGGSARDFAAALCRGGQLSEADVDELKAYFHMKGEGRT